MAATPRTRTTKAAAAGVRERILDAALATLRKHGLRKLTQVRVAQRARVRQSHLTYYFPAREDLLEAVAQRVVDEIARHAAGIAGMQGSRVAMLTRLVAAVADSEHMRMFIGLIAEADDEPRIRALLVDGTRQIEAAVATALGNEGSERARIVLAAAWGHGLYHFLMRPSAEEDPTRTYLSWLAEAAQASGAARADSRNSPTE